MIGNVTFSGTKQKLFEWADLSALCSRKTGCLRFCCSFNSGPRIRRYALKGLRAQRCHSLHKGNKKWMFIFVCQYIGVLVTAVLTDWYTRRMNALKILRVKMNWVLDFKGLLLPVKHHFWERIQAHNGHLLSSYLDFPEIFLHKVFKKSYNW